MKDLTFVETDDLLEELKSRFSELVIIATYKDNSSSFLHTLTDYKGDYIPMLGLIEILKHDILLDRDTTRTDEEPV